MVGQAAYTLIELLVGVMILGIVLATAFTGMQQGFYLLENARDNTLVSQLLQSEMENLRTMNWASINLMTSPSSFLPEIGSFSELEDRYTCQRLINTPKANQLQVVLSVVWTDSRGIDHLNNYVSYFSKDGLNDYYSL